MIMNNRPIFNIEEVNKIIREQEVTVCGPSLRKMILLMTTVILEMLENANWAPYP